MEEVGVVRETTFDAKRSSCSEQQASHCGRRIRLLHQLLVAIRASVSRCWCRWRPASPSPSQAYSAASATARALYIAGTTALLGVVAYLPLPGLFDREPMGRQTQRRFAQVKRFTSRKRPGCRITYMGDYQLSEPFFRRTGVGEAIDLIAHASPLTVFAGAGVAVDETGLTWYELIVRLLQQAGPQCVA